MKVSLIELFSGIGGFAKGLEEAGMEIENHYFSEVDKHAIANYKYNFKDAEYIGSVTDVSGHELRKRHPKAKIIVTFGSPCQDFSLAGKRKGIEGERSSLILQAIRIVFEVQPSVFLWENVKGTFSSNNGADFWAILAAFTNIGNYRLEWQLLNTSWVLPQNRERIYLVGHLAGRSEPGVFPFTENDGLFNIAANSGKGRPQAQYSTALKSSGAMKADDTFVSVPKIAGCLTGGGHSGGLHSGGLHSDMTVIPVLTPDRTEKRQNGRRFKEAGEPSFTLNCQDMHGVMISEKIEIIQKSQDYREDGSLRCFKKNSPTIRANMGDNLPLVKTNKIRRLTEIECERLQGFPDDWTKFGNYDGEIKEISKTQRYKMLGNAVTVDVVKAVVSRLKLITKRT